MHISARSITGQQLPPTREVLSRRRCVQRRNAQMALVLTAVLVSLSACLMPRSSRERLGLEHGETVKDHDRHARVQSLSGLRIRRHQLSRRTMPSGWDEESRFNQRSQLDGAHFAGRVGGGLDGAPISDNTRGRGRPGRVMPRGGGMGDSMATNNSFARGARGASAGRARGRGGLNTQAFMSENKETMNRARRGAFILFEGIDRCGKTTQSQRLVDALTKKGMKTKHMRFPDRTTTIGKMINSYLTNAVETDDKSIHLLFAANRWEKMKEMRKLLEDGVNLVVDRYSYSGVAFTASKGYDIEWCYHPEVGMLEPDIVMWLDMPLEDVKERGGFGEERYEKLEMQEKVQRIFGQFAKANGSKWQHIDARGTVENIHANISNIALDKIRTCAQTSVSFMKPLESFPSIEDISADSK